MPIWKNVAETVTKTSGDCCVPLLTHVSRSFVLAPYASIVVNKDQLGAVLFDCSDANLFPQCQPLAMKAT